jgi:ATP sulfurylase
MISAHGGRLVNRIVTGAERDRLIEMAPSLPRLVLNSRETSDLDMISIGAMSPLQGFMTKEQYTSVLEQKRLPSGLPWPLPIVAAVKPGTDASQYVEGKDVALFSADEQLLAILHLSCKWQMDKSAEARAALTTDDAAHPGVQYLGTIGDTYLGGEISVVNKVAYSNFNSRRLDPKETRFLFEQRGWNSVVAFQTRNPIHRAHEYLTKVALEIVDGLMIHPLMGETKSDDIPGDVRMSCYESLLENYYPQDRTVLAIYPQAMRYAGPREAILHALVRKNYGCTHFIVGRDHAGVGSYYGTYDAQHIFREFGASEIGIEPLMFEHSFFCKKTGGMATAKTSNSGKEDKVFLSGTQVRAMLADGVMPPPEFTRPEVAQILIEAMRKKDPVAAS